MSCHALRAHGGDATGLDPLRHRDEVAGRQKVLVLKAVLEAPRWAGGCGGYRLRAQAAAVNRLWHNELSEREASRSRAEPPPGPRGRRLKALEVLDQVALVRIAE